MADNYKLSYTAEEIEERLDKAGNAVLFTEQTLTEEQQAHARENIGVIQGFESTTVESTNLLDESTVIKGSYWDESSGELTSNQYTASYYAFELRVSGLSAVTLSYNMFVSMNAPYLPFYWIVYADGTSTNTKPSNGYAYIQTIAIPSNAVSIRIGLSSSRVLGTDWNIMVNEGTTALPYEPWFEPYTEIPALESNFRPLREGIAAINSTLNPRIILGSKLHAVVGDTIQVFYKSLFDGKIGNLHIMFECAKGKNYPRYWEYTPGTSDVGSYPITIKLLNNAGDVIAERTSTLNVVSAANPASAKNVLCVGDSTMENGQIPIEASRRMKGTPGAATSPTALALSNLNFVGRKKNADGSVGWEGTGGWTYESYIISGYTAVRFTVTEATDLNIGAVYQVGNFKLSIAEINVTGGSGNVRCLFYYATPYSSAWDSTAQSGTMTLASGDGQSSVSFSKWAKETYQPFWNPTTNKWDITGYRDSYCNGQLDVVCVLLGINSLIGKTPFTEVSVTEAKTLFTNIHSQLPNCKIIVSTLPPVSPNGGIAANYGASSAIGAYSAGVKNRMVADFNLALIDLAESDEFSSYVILANSHAQFDSENGYPTINKALNTRTTTTEALQSNGVHPNNSGYWQISDAMAFRACLYAVSL